MKRNLPYIEVLCIIYLAFLAITTSYRCIELDKSNRHLSNLVVKLTKENEKLLQRNKYLDERLYNLNYDMQHNMLPSNWHAAPMYKGVK